MMNSTQADELWNNEGVDLISLLKKENEDIDELPLPVIQNIQNKILIQKLHKRLYTLEEHFYYPQTLTLEGCEQLNSIAGEHWTSRFYTLFREAQIPPFYILDVWKDDINIDNNIVNDNDNDNDTPTHKDNNTRFDIVPHTVYIQLITYRAKMLAKSKLNLYFSTLPNCSININD
jgi:hypothetical protein